MARLATDSTPSTEDGFIDPFGDPLAHSFDEPSSKSARVNRMRAEDLGARGIPAYRNASGDVSAVTDATGAALSGLDARHGIAYDSQGQAKQISYGESGPPILEDPFAKLPARTDPKTGAVEKYGPGGIYQYLGQDENVTAQIKQADDDKATQKQTALLGRKLTLDEHDLNQGTKEKKRLHGELTGQVPGLLDPKFDGADLPTITKAIDEHFNAEYAAPEANQSAGWFSKELSPEAQARRADIDARKAKAYDTAQGIFALNDRMTELQGNVETGRASERAGVETLLAHSQGQLGPLDQEQPAAEEAKEPAALSAG
jgi:hypothetical protein